MPPIIDRYLITSPAALAAIAKYNENAWRYYAKANAFAEELGAERLVSMGDVKYMEELALSGEARFKPGETVPPGFGAPMGVGVNAINSVYSIPNAKTKAGKDLRKRFKEIYCPYNSTVFIMAGCDTPSCYWDNESGHNRFFNDFIKAERSDKWTGTGYARSEAFYLHRMRRAAELEAPIFKGFILQQGK